MMTMPVTPVSDDFMIGEFNRTWRQLDIEEADLFPENEWSDEEPYPEEMYD